MSCHGNDNNNSDKNGKCNRGHLSHMIMMLICCGAPIILLLLIPLIKKIGLGTGANGLSLVATLACPIMMAIMLPSMFKKQKDK